MARVRASAGAQARPPPPSNAPGFWFLGVETPLGLLVRPIHRDWVRIVTSRWARGQSQVLASISDSCDRRMENILNRRSERIFVVWRGNVGRNDQVYPARRRDLVRRTTGAKAFLSFGKSRAPAADSLRKLRHAIKRQVLFGLRATGDRLSSLLSARHCRCPRLVP